MFSSSKSSEKITKSNKAHPRKNIRRLKFKRKTHEEDISFLNCNENIELNDERSFIENFFHEGRSSSSETAKNDLVAGKCVKTRIETSFAFGFFLKRFKKVSSMV